MAVWKKKNYLIVELMAEVPELMHVAGGAAVAGAHRTGQRAVGTRLLLLAASVPP
jgi:hypothetical protein